MKFRFSLFTTLLFLSFCKLSMAQTPATTDIKGFVYDNSTGEPVIFVNVLIKGTTIGCQTDKNGFFSIKKIATGNYTLISFGIGYDTTSKEVTAKLDDITNEKIFLSKKTRTLRSIKVSGRKMERTNNTEVSEIKVSPNQIKQLPSVGEPDLAQYLQVVPGVVSSGDQGGQLYIRGGSPVQNKIMLDGMTIYNPFHSIGLFSVFETDIMKSADVHTAGFNAEYGGATSAVIDVSTRDGNRKRLSGKIAASTFAGKVILEGPLKKMDENGGGSTTFILSAKSSYLDKSSKIFYPNAGSDGKSLPYNFTDLYGKISFNSSSGSKLNLFGFDFADNANYTGVAQYGWTSYGGGANFIITPAGSTTLITGHATGSSYSMSLIENDGLPRTSTISNASVGLDFGYILENNSNFNYGVELNNNSTSLRFYNNQGISYGDGLDQSSTEISAYMKYKKTIGNLIIEPGLRLPFYATLNVASFEPRIAMKYNATKDFRIKFAAGRYSQNLISSKNDRDVVNLFTGFLSGPQETLYGTDGKEVSSKLQTAWHAVGGVEYDLGKNVELTAETYIKQFTQIINISRDKQNVQDPNFMVETGNAYGLDLLAKYEYKRFYFWVGYSLSYSNRFDGTKNADGSDKSYQPSFDRRHNLNLLSSYTFGKNLNWDVSVRYNFGTGFPFTRTQGYYPSYNFLDGAYSNYINQQPTLGITYENSLNQGRLPNYHRVDVSLKRKFFVGKNGVLEANFSITNTLNRENIFYFDRVTYKRINQLPFLPAVGVNYTF